MSEDERAVSYDWSRGDRSDYGDIRSEAREPAFAPSSNPFYALASSTSVWTYHYVWQETSSRGPSCSTSVYSGDSDREGKECCGLWPLEALCLALLLDEGVRCDVALAVGFAQCLKVADHIRRIDVHTRREVAFFEATNTRRRYDDYWDDIPTEYIDKLEAETPMIRRYAPNEDGYLSSHTRYENTIAGYIARCELPPSDHISSEIKNRKTYQLLRTATSAILADVAVLVYNVVASDGFDDVGPLEFCVDSLLTCMLCAGMKRFKILTGILLRSEHLRRIFFLAETSWETLWSVRCPEDASMMVRTFQLSPTSLMGSLENYHQLTSHQMRVVYAVYETLGRLKEVDFIGLFPYLIPESIEVVKAKGHYDKLFSNAAEWIPAFVTPYHFWTVELLQYMKDAGASFEGAAQVFERTFQSATYRAWFHKVLEGLKLCIESDTLFPSEFSPSSTLKLLLLLKVFDYEYSHGPRKAQVVSAVLYLHGLAVQHNLLAPDTVAGESLLTVVVQDIDGTVKPHLHIGDLTGEPTIVFREGCRDALKIVAPRDPLQLDALFLAVEIGNVDAVDYLSHEFHLDLKSIQHPTRGKLLADFAEENCKHQAMLDYLTIKGLFDGVQPSFNSSLILGCQQPSIIRLLHFVKNTDFDPFQRDEKGLSLLVLFARKAQDYKATCALVRCICDRYASDPRWAQLLEEFVFQVARGFVTHYAGITWFSSLFFVLQRSKMDSALLNRCLALTNRCNYPDFQRAASVDYTVESAEYCGKAIKVTFDKAHVLVPDGRSRHSKKSSKKIKC